MSNLSKDAIALLSAPLEERYLKQHPTKTYLSVINPMGVVERLNQVFGVGKWHFQTDFINCIEVTNARGKVNYMGAVLGRLSVPEYNILIEQYGGSTNEDMGDALKGSATDALTKCASYLDVGGYIYRGEYDNSKPSTAPSTAKTKRYPDPAEVKGVPFGDDEED